MLLLIVVFDADADGADADDAGDGADVNIGKERVGPGGVVSSKVMCVDIVVDVDGNADVVADADVNIGKERVGLGGVRGYADVCVELHYGRGQHH